MRTPGIIGLSGKWPGKKLSFIVTFLIATAETPGLCSITLSTRRNGNLTKPKTTTTANSFIVWEFKTTIKEVGFFSIN